MSQHGAGRECHSRRRKRTAAAHNLGPGKSVFVVAAHASDPGESSGVRWSGLMLFVLLALGAYFFNAHAVRRYRSRH